MEYSLKIESSEAGTNGILSLVGDLTMVSALETRKALLEAIAEVDILELDLEKAASVDISFLQLLCSAHRECFFSGKGIILLGGMTDKIEELLQRSGYSSQFGCLTDAKKSCLWSTLSSSKSQCHVTT